VFSGIPWRLAGDSARRLIEQRGFTWSREIEDGDVEYSRADGALLLSTLQNGRLVGVTLIDPTRGAAVNARFQAVADSLRAALGPPDTANARFATWERALTSVDVENAVTGTARHVEIRWHGPGWYDEINRRAEYERPGEVNFSPRPAGYTIVSANGFARIAVDTTRLVRRGGVLHGRFRIEYVRTVGPDSAMYDTAEYDMDFDCAGNRTRLTSRTTLLSGRIRRAETFHTLPWETPTADGHYARGLRAACRVDAARSRTSRSPSSPAPRRS
jgi:hypothetical protein